MEDRVTFVRVRAAKRMGDTAALAREIWTEHYVPIIGRLQVEYMLERFQTADAIAAQLKEGYSYFLIRRSAQDIGYIAVTPAKDGNVLFLSKFYVRARERGRGYGKKALRFIEDFARRGGFPKIALTVNKNNSAAIRAYEKMGFVNAGAVVQDIGGGFFMDDYKMEKEVGS